MSESYFPEDEPMSAPANMPGNEFDDDVYKKWFKAGGKSGFLSIAPAFGIGRVSVDIGETGEGGLKGSTKVWTNAIQLAVYLRAVYEGEGAKLFPKNRDTPTPEGFVYYGGGNIDGKPVSRILKIHHWQTGRGDDVKYDTSAFVWKCGHFAAKTTQSGAFIPDMTKPLSTNLIKVTRKEMAEIHYRLDLGLQAFAAKEKDLFRALNGNK